MPRPGDLLTLALILAGCAEGASVDDTAQVTTAPTVPPTPSSTGAETTVPTTLAPTTPSTEAEGAAVPETMPPDRPPVPSDPQAERGAAVVAAGGAMFLPDDGGPASRLQEGVVVAVEGRRGDTLHVFTPCETRGTVPVTETALTGPGPGSGATWSEAVFVIDAGHGGPVNTGAQGPGGLWERDANIDIARRAVALLSTGASVDGIAYPPVRAAMLTRRSGPPDANYEAGTGFRAAVANQLHAAALVSIHNNAGADNPLALPGSEAFYRYEDPASRRLAGLVVEDLLAALAPFGSEWVGDSNAGARYRLNNDREDYYSLLRNAEVPAVIAEGAYVSAPVEEALLSTGAFRQAYAEAVYRALVRFVTTDMPGSHFTGEFDPGVDVPPGGARPDCALPLQP